MASLKSERTRKIFSLKVEEWPGSNLRSIIIVGEERRQFFYKRKLFLRFPRRVITFKSLCEFSWSSLNLSMGISYIIIMQTIIIFFANELLYTHHSLSVNMGVYNHILFYRYHYVLHVSSLSFFFFPPQPPPPPPTSLEAA